MRHFILGLLLISCLLNAKAEKFDIIIKNANIVDIEHDSIIENCDLGIKNRKILRITSGNGLKHDESSIQINAEGKYIIPGLWDMHVHLYYPDKAYLKMYLAHGVVGVREMSGRKFHWKDSTNTNPNIPEIIFGSKGCDGPVPWFDSKDPVKTPDEAREMVRKAKNDGFDFIKIFSLVPRDQYLAIIDECKKLNMEVSGHVPLCMNILESAKLGHKTNEHLEGMLRASSTFESKIQKGIDSLLMEFSKKEGINDTMKAQVFKCTKKSLGSFSQEKADSVITELNKYDMFQCPTLSVLHDFALERLEWIYTDDRYEYALPFFSKPLRPTESELERTSKSRSKLKLKEKLLLQMHQKGIKILAGTDQGCGGYDLHDELEYLVNAGFSTSESLKAATINPAIYLGKESSMGSIATGKLADIVILNSNPLDKISNTRDIDKVIFKGKVLHPTKLKEEAKRTNELITIMINEQEKQEKQ